MIPALDQTRPDQTAWWKLRQAGPTLEAELGALKWTAMSVTTSEADNLIGWQAVACRYHPETVAHICEPRVSSYNQTPDFHYEC